MKKWKWKSDKNWEGFDLASVILRLYCMNYQNFACLKGEGWNRP